MLGARSFVLRGMGRLEEASEAAQAEQALAEQLAEPELEAMANHDRGLVALDAGRAVKTLADRGPAVRRPRRRRTYQPTADPPRPGGSAGAQPPAR